MKKNLHDILPWIALTSGFLVLVLAMVAIISRPDQGTVNPENKKIVTEKLGQIHPDSKEAFSSQAFFDFADQALRCNIIHTIWIFNEKSELIYVKGQMARSTPLNSIADSLTGSQNRGLIAAVEENLDPLQKQLITIAAAIRREGEHNDIYGHQVVPVKTNQNEPVGFIGVAYSLGTSKPSASICILEISLLIFFLIYWLSIPAWVYLDSRQRNENRLLWTLFTLIGNLPAYIAYLIVRK